MLSVTMKEQTWCEFGIYVYTYVYKLYVSMHLGMYSNHFGLSERIQSDSDRLHPQTTTINWKTVQSSINLLN